MTDKIRHTIPAQAITFPEHVEAFINKLFETKPLDTELIVWRLGEVEHIVSDGQWVLSAEWIPERNGW